MNFYGMTRRALAAIGFSMALFCLEGNCMDEWPTMALDGTPEHPEPQALIEYRRRRIECAHAYCFIPKNEEEVKLLYSLYLKGRLPSWNLFTNNMGSELSERLDIGDMYFIDKYIEHIDTFISLMMTHEDRGFVEGLFGFWLSNTLGEYGVCYAWSAATRESVPLTKEQALYVIFRLNTLLNKTNLYPIDVLIDAYFMKSFSEEVKALCVSVKKMYEERNLPIPERLK